MPGLVSRPSSAAATAVGEKFRDIVTKHNNHIDDVEELHKVALDEVVQTVLHSVGLEDDVRAEKHVRHFIDGRATLFRFYRRSRYSVATALDMLTATLTWRLRTDLDSLSLASLHPLYTTPPARPPLFWANSGCFDRYGRPAGIISLQSLERVTHDDGSSGLGECREYIVGCMESVRRYLDTMYDAALGNTQTAQPIDLDKIENNLQDDDAQMSDRLRQPLQMVIIFSLQSSGMANLELELLPFLLDLLKNHFPGMVGAVYILHFGWVHSGMWALAKRILPQQALARIFFPSNKDMEEHFALERLPECFGGTMDIKLTERTNDIMRQYAQARWTRHKTLLRKGELPEAQGDSVDERDSDDEIMSAPPSPRGLSGTSTPRASISANGAIRGQRPFSRAGSYDSLVDEFHSLVNSPWNSRSATPRSSRPTTPHVEHPAFLMSRTNEANRPGFKTPEALAGLSKEGTLRITPSAASKLRHLQMLRGESSHVRSRSNSENMPFPAQAPSASTTAPVERMSPIASRPTSPIQGRRRTLTVPQARQLRNVHFNEQQQQGAASMSGGSGLGINMAENGITPIQRVGSLRDFRLYDGDQKQLNLSDSSSDESERSGKAGETASQAKQNQQKAAQQASGGFFARFRRSPHLSSGAVKNEQSKSTNESDYHEDDEDSLLALSPEPRVPDSPRLQVPDIEEPPLAETTRFFSRRSHKYGNLPGHVSPYNASNPFYGYPALPESTSEASSSAVRLSSRRQYGLHGADAAVIASHSNDPRRHYRFRKRKRDLVRTLVYLFVLRLLAMHRHVRAALLATYRGTVHALSVGGLTGDAVGALDEDGVYHSAASIQQQHERYELLRNAGTRFSMSAPSGSSYMNETSSQRRKRRKASTVQSQQPRPQPLVALGMRKRYILLSLVVMFVILRRYEWRRRRS